MGFVALFSLTLVIILLFLFCYDLQDSVCLLASNVAQWVMLENTGNIEIEKKEQNRERKKQQANELSLR